MSRKGFDAAAALDPDSSTDPETSDAGAESSTADGNEPTLLDAIQDAVSSEPDSSSGADGEEGDDLPDDLEGDEPEGDDDGEDAGDDGEAGDQDTDSSALTEEQKLEQFFEDMRAEGKNLQKIARFQEIYSENKDLKTQVEAFQGELEEYRQATSHLDMIAQAAERAGRPAEEMANLLALPILFEQDPAKALERLQAIGRDWAAAAGDLLPPDLQEKVDDGRMSEEDARELSRARAGEKRATQRSEYDAQQRAEEAKRTQIKESGDALNAYQQSLQKNDPDYTSTAAKWHRDRLLQKVRAEGLPQTKEAAVKMAEAAWAEVKGELAELKPQPKPKTPISGRRSNRAPAAEPGSMLEAISNAVGGATTED